MSEKFDTFSHNKEPTATPVKTVLDTLKDNSLATTPLKSYRKRDEKVTFSAVNKRRTISEIATIEELDEEVEIQPEEGKKMIKIEPRRNTLGQI